MLMVEKETRDGAFQQLFRPPGTESWVLEAKKEATTKEHL